MTNSAGLTAAEFLQQYRYEPETGNVFRRFQHPKCRAPIDRPIGTLTVDGRFVTTIRGRNYHVSRIAWLLHTGEWPKHQIDHINRNPSDNRIENLRDVPHVVNQYNRGEWGPGRKCTGAIGVQLEKSGRFGARIKVSGRVKCLGRFDTIEAARAAYLAAKTVLHPSGL